MSRMKGQRSFQTLGLLLLTALLLMGISRCDLKTLTPHFTCTDVSVTVLPGTCVQLDNPCDAAGQWLSGDAFGLLEPMFGGISVETQKRSAFTTRQLCASASVGLLVLEPVPYAYVSNRSFGEATIFVTTGNPLSVTASANPDTIDPGQSTQLDAVVAGGTAPFTFSWSPSAGLSADNVQNPLATPDFTTTYTVEVTDTNGLTANDSVTVTVNQPPGVLTACMTPAGGDIFPPYTVSGACSGGPNPIVEYCWYFNWSGNPVQDNFPDVCSDQPSANIAGEPGGAQDVRLRVEDNTGARAAVVHNFILQP